ncbi:MAG: DUF6763 family protein [Gammaproteobacteria bacterium]
MDADPSPIIGHWYQGTGTERPLLVVNVDEELDVIEIQYPDGETGKIDSTAWTHMSLALAAPPKHKQDFDEDDSNEGAMD